MEVPQCCRWNAVLVWWIVEWTLAFRMCYWYCLFSSHDQSQNLIKCVFILSLYVLFCCLTLQELSAQSQRNKQLEEEAANLIGHSNHAQRIKLMERKNAEYNELSKVSPGKGGVGGPQCLMPSRWGCLCIAIHSKSDKSPFIQEMYKYKLFWIFVDIMRSIYCVTNSFTIKMSEKEQTNGVIIIFWLLLYFWATHELLLI